MGCKWGEVMDQKSCSQGLTSSACVHELEMFATYVFLLKILTLIAGSMNAILLRLVTVGEQIFRVTECYNYW